jgi:hypothetical protein
LRIDESIKDDAELKRRMVAEREGRRQRLLQNTAHMLVQAMVGLIK